MNIIIVGAGRVGASVAETLCSEQNDITVIDTDPVVLAVLQERFDLRTVVGNGIHPSVLRAAGAEEADMLIAVAAHDETNLTVCCVASTQFNVPTRIARVRAAEFQNHPELTGEQGFGVHHVICPEQSVTDYIKKLVEVPKALQVLEFAQGRVSLVALRAYPGGALTLHPIHELRKQMGNIDLRIVAIFRNDCPITPEGDTLLQAGDEVFVLLATEHMRPMLKELFRLDKPARRILIAGGGNIGFRLARALEHDYSVKVIECDKRRCEYLANELDSKTLVLYGDATDEGLLSDENVQEMDLFLALTNDDENNIMSALLAKRMGARRVIALINRNSYGELMQGGQIDIAIAPAQTTIGALLTHIRRGDIVGVHSLRRGAAEALEIIAHGDSKSSKVIGKRIDQIELPKDAYIGAIVRGAGAQSKVIIAHHDIVLEPEDHVIVFVSNKRMIKKVEKLFQVAAGFF